MLGIIQVLGRTRGWIVGHDGLSQNLTADGIYFVDFKRQQVPFSVNISPIKNPGSSASSNSGE
jgi:hypothetical protein